MIYWSGILLFLLEQSIEFLSSQLTTYERKMSIPELSEITEKKHPLHEFCNQTAEILTIATTNKANSIHKRLHQGCQLTAGIPFPVEHRLSDQWQHHGQCLQRTIPGSPETP